MSLATNIANLATRVATEAKALRTLINGNQADLSALTTTTKTNLVAAVNEVKASIGGGGATTLDGLTDVTISAPATGHLLRNNGSGQFVNVLGTTYFEVAGAAASAQSASQPLDSDLTAIAALSTTAFGRGILALADAAALTAAVNASSTALPGIVELATTVEATTGTDTTRAVTPAGLQAGLDALVAGAPGTLNTLNEIATQLATDESAVGALTTTVAGKQPLDSDLTAISALTSAADKLPYSTGAAAWSMATFTTFGRSLVDDADATAARVTIDTYSTTQIGDPTTDFVATFNAGLV